MPNPFKPTAGKMPPILIGRENVVTDFAEGLENGAGAPSRLMLLSGQRGYGKTVLLVELARVALSYGWEVVRQTASPGMCERIVEALRGDRLRATAVSVEPSVEVAGVAGAKLGRVSFDKTDALSVRNAIERRLKKLDDGKGILFTIDEAQAASTDEMVALATALQEVIGDEDLRDVPDIQKHGVAFVFAGLPSVVDGLVNERVLTFLRRATRHSLGSIPLPDVRNAYQITVEESGLMIESDVAMAAAQASTGYPYMIQLVGYYMWQSAKRRRSTTIEMSDVNQAEKDATMVFLDAVCAPAFVGLTDAQQTFLKAMSEDWPDSSSVTEVARRAGKSAAWGAAYRRSLIDANVIASAGRGLVSYAIPHFGEYMQELD